MDMFNPLRIDSGKAFISKRQVILLLNLWPPVVHSPYSPCYDSSNIPMYEIYSWKMAKPLFVQNVLSRFITMMSYILRRWYLYINNSMCIWSWINFKEFHTLVIKIWACILRVGVLPHVSLISTVTLSDPDWFSAGNISSGWHTMLLILMTELRVTSHPDDLSSMQYVVQMTYHITLCHPDDLAEVCISSEWITVGGLIMSSGWHTLPILSHPDEIADIANFHNSRRPFSASVYIPLYMGCRP